MPSTNTNLFLSKNKSLSDFSYPQYLSILNDITRRVEEIETDPKPSPYDDHVVYTWPRLLIGVADNFNSYPELYRTVYLKYEILVAKFRIMVSETIPNGDYYSDDYYVQRDARSEFYLLPEQAFAFGCKLHLQFEKELQRKNLSMDILRLSVP